MSIILCWAGFHRWRPHHFTSNRRVCKRCRLHQRVTFSRDGLSSWWGDC